MDIDKKEIAKRKILTDFFSLKFNDPHVRGEEVKKELRYFLDKYGDDQHIKDALDVGRVRSMENHVRYHDEAIEIAIPIVERLLNKEIWDNLDVTFAYAVVGNTETPEQAIELVNRIFKYEGVIENIKLNALFNASNRLLKTKFKESVNLPNITKVFNNYIDQGLKLAEKNEDPFFNEIFTKIFLMRKDLYEGNDKEAKAHLETFKDDFSTYYPLLHEFEEIMELKEKFGSNEFIESERLGNNIKKLRKESGISLRNLGKLVDMDVSNLSKYERGVMRNISIKLIYRLSEAFNVPITTLFHGIPIEDETSDLLEMKNRLDFLISDFSKKELQAAITTLQALKQILKGQE